MRLQTQWRAGFSGPTGLDYRSVMIVMRTHNRRHGQRWPIPDYAECFEHIQVMELEALRVFRERKK